MGRKQFREDLAAVSLHPPTHIHSIETTDDGEISFNYIYTESGVKRTAGLQLLALNVDDYPQENEYMIFTRDGDVDASIANAFELLCPLIRNRSIEDALTSISTNLPQTTISGRLTAPIVQATTSDVDDEGYHNQGGDQQSEEEDSEEDWLAEAEDEAFGFDEPKRSGLTAIGPTSLTQIGAEGRQKIRTDLRQAREAGFKIGIIGDPSTSGIVSIAVRVLKLGISEEVMKAWSLKAHQYFVLLIRFQTGYFNIDDLREESTLAGSTEIRLGLCSSYRPNTKSAFDAFNDSTKDLEPKSQISNLKQPADLEPLFIGRPLNELFRTRFTRIVKFREVFRLSWAGAEQLVHDTQGAMVETGNMTKYRLMTDDTNRALPPLAMADSICDRQLKHCSLPLVAMQFALRHFVRCTDFCLVCHCSSGSTFEALKPYVCSNPLCLYQYMGLGFGPSIEWEILSQPYVVDLLISFCYVQAQAGRLREFPVGIDLKIPVLPTTNTSTAGHNGNTGAYRPVPIPTPQPDVPHKSPSPERAFCIAYNAPAQELLFPADKVELGRDLKKGDFIALVSTPNFEGVVYHRIADVMVPSVKLGPPHRIGESGKDSDKNKPLPQKVIDVDCYLFNHDFDTLSNYSKAKAITTLLDTIPPVQEMLLHLKAHSSGQDVSLKQWRDRISPSALNVLRWVIASNRSCIMQVDSIAERDAQDGAQSFEDRVTGMDEYMQFRFAQGAPDKEQRFVNCVHSETAGNKYPTIFAWHGSPLSNWHSIIREGLHFRDTLHGRAYGHGVYMSSQAATSTGYMNPHVYGNHGASKGWPNSELKISGAMSLNEVVNKPTSFVSSSPHYVVAQTEWIQTRYLFVKTAANHTRNKQLDVELMAQDPKHAVLGMDHQAVGIPVTAVSKSRAIQQQGKKVESRKRKLTGTGRADHPLEINDDDDESVTTLDEDRSYLLDDESHTGRTPIDVDSLSEVELSDADFDMISLPVKKMRQDQPATKMRIVEGCLLDPMKTSFIPGSLDMSNIKFLPPPEDASRAASSQLLKAFQSLLKSQSTLPIDELGWYVNPEHVDNMYQWIVELHTFDKAIPLAQDMETAGIGSIVLEMRFTNQYPFAPPFVRVVKPRFLPFSQGGGGHVTEGGAICMELLTNNGWSAASTIESVLMQVRLAISDMERPARLSGRRGHERSREIYGVGEAMNAYERACRAHGWTVPPAFASLQRIDADSSKAY